MNFYVRAKKRTSYPKPSPGSKRIAEDYKEGEWQPPI
jgi:hypothetical protein